MDVLKIIGKKSIKKWKPTQGQTSEARPVRIRGKHQIAMERMGMVKIPHLSRLFLAEHYLA